MQLKSNSTMPFRFSGSAGRYEVLLDGEVIGTVERWERRYRLRRTLVTRGWRARLVGGSPLYHQDGYTANTRAGAAEALIRHGKAEIE
jgi:hypothetical protein